MNPFKLIIGIESCTKYTLRQDAVRKTWLKDCIKLGVRAYFLVGRPGQESEIQGDVLYLNCGDNYLDLPQKTIAFLDFVEKKLSFTHIYKCDDDTFLNLPALLSFTPEPYDYCGDQDKVMRVDAGWHVKHVEPHLRNQPYPGTYIGPWMRGGSGYFLSKKAVQCAVKEYTKFINKEFYEDKLIGDIMRTNKISFLIDKSFKEITFFNIYFLSSIARRKLSLYISIHPCSCRELIWFYQKRHFFLFVSFFLKYIRLKVKFPFK